jgi:hypothetical protein
VPYDRGGRDKPGHDDSVRTEHGLAKGPGIDYKRRFRLQSDFGVRRLIKECEETEHGCAEEKDVAV